MVQLKVHRRSKPKQTKEPVRNPKRKTKKWFGEVKNWGINQCKAGKFNTRIL